jgi:thiol-disulfide isomerase/thioredoxin
MKVVALLLLAAGAWAQAPKGLWDCTLTVEDRKVDFRMSFSGNGEKFRGSIMDGAQQVESTSGSFAEGKLALRWEYYDARLEATIEKGLLEGTYTRRTKRGPVSRAFSARPHAPAKASGAKVAQVAGTWRFQLDTTDKVKAMDGVFRQSGDVVTGTLQRVDGDFGTLEGRINGRSLRLSHFDGIRATLVEAALTEKGTLEGSIDGRTKFRAARVDEAKALGLAEPPDPSRYTAVKNPEEPMRFRFADLDGNPVSTEDERFRGKAMIVTIMGSWCPNCHDEAEVLKKLYQEYRAKGLEIVALGFEYSGDPATDRAQLKAFSRRHETPYTVLLAGTTDEGAVPKALPQLADFGSYPTTIYLDRQHRVAVVHAGFAGPANFEEHSKLVAEMRALVERLLAGGR